MAGLVYSSTMLGLLIFFELTGVCSWGLIGYYDNEKARKAALKAIIMTQVASLGLYAATAYFFAIDRRFAAERHGRFDRTMRRSSSSSGC